MYYYDDILLRSPFLNFSSTKVVRGSDNACLSKPRVFFLFSNVGASHTIALSYGNKNRTIKRLLVTLPYPFLAHLSRRLIGELIVYPCSGVRPSVVRPSSTISKIFSETAGPIVLILHIHHLQVGGKNNCVFCFDRIRTLVSMATYASHRLIMEKVKIASFCCLVGDI